MKKIFIFSTPYITRTLLFYFDYILNFKIDTVHLLKENHDIDEKFTLNSDVQIKFYENMFDAAINSDVIFAFSDNYIPDKSILFLKNLADKYEKEYYEIEGFMESNSFTDKNLYNKDLMYYGKPVILLTSFGKHTQKYCTEILLHKIFSNISVNFIQSFSMETKKLLSQFSKYGIIRDSLRVCVDEVFKVPDDYNIIITTLAESDMTTDNPNLDLIQVIKNISPNYVILDVDVMFNNYDMLKTLFLYRYNININCFIHSSYASFIPVDNVNLPMYYNRDITIINSLYIINSIESNQIEKSLSSNIFSKLALPKEVYIL